MGPPSSSMDNDGNGNEDDIQEGKEEEGSDRSIFREPIVDEMRGQKDDELMRYRREVERRLKLAGSSEKSKKSSIPKAEKKTSTRKKRRVQSKASSESQEALR